MKTSGLSLEQAPPIGIPLKFFLTASLFFIVLGLLLIVRGEQLYISRWSPLALGLTHLVTLGFLSQVMVGAMVQLMPVLGGTALASPVAIGHVMYLSLSLGPCFSSSVFSMQGLHS